MILRVARNERIFCMRGIKNRTPRAVTLEVLFFANCYSIKAS